LLLDLFIDFAWCVIEIEGGVEDDACSAAEGSNAGRLEHSFLAGF
jgi:hypothetical protein